MGGVGKPYPFSHATIRSEPMDFEVKLGEKVVTLTGDELRRIVYMSIDSLTKLKKMEGSTFPKCDRDTLEKSWDIAHILYNDFDIV